LAANALPEASDVLGDALEDPRTAQSAYQLLATVQQRLGNNPAAERARLVAASLPPDEKWPDAYISQATQWRAGEQARIDHGQHLLAQGKAAEALQLAKRVVEDYPRSSEGWLLLGRVRFQIQDCPGSEGAIRQHLQLDSSSVSGYTQLGIALICQERFAEAATAFSEALKYKPDLGQAHFNLGYSRRQINDLAGARTALEDAIRYNPDFVEAYVALGQLKVTTGDTAGARNLFKLAAQLRPGDEQLQKLLSE
jgi:Tfp pilus assembly protein PilF